jgi:hypothetical protein
MLTFHPRDQHTKLEAVYLKKPRSLTLNKSNFEG